MPDTESDAELLRRFLTARDDVAFAQLVGRHGGLVMGVCRRVLGHPHDAEDAFQATFLLLARKAASLRSAVSLPAWLHQTAYRTALRARAVAARRREQPWENTDVIQQGTLTEIAEDHGRSVLDEELNRLPEKYRLPLFLCAIEGHSREDAATQLGCTASVLKGRLERGRQLLRRRLAVRGVTLSAVALASVVPASASAASISPALVASTVQASLQHLAGQGALGHVTQNALSLASGGTGFMSLTSKVVIGSAVVLGCLVFGSSWLPGPAVAVGDSSGSLSLTLQDVRPSTDEPQALVARLADGQGQRPAARDGNRGARRDGAGPRSGPREGDGVRPGPRDGELRRGPREGDAPGRMAPREGQYPAPPMGQEGGNPLANFRPQTPREAALLQLIVQLQRQLQELQREVHALRGGQPPARPLGMDRREGPQGDGDGARPGPREGDGARPGRGIGERD